MIKTINKIGNSRGLIFDSALLQLAKLKEGDEVNVEVHSGGTITITPLRPQPSEEEIDRAISETMDGYSTTLAKLAK
jgi:antitoxin component of MazEF toxin-antitoxin module